jgi:hypothetical protein
MTSNERIIREEESIKDTEKELEGLVPVTAVVKQNADVVYSVRFSRPEIALLRQAAARKGMKLSELIRSSTLKAAKSELDPAEKDLALAEVRRRTSELAEAVGRL